MFQIYKITNLINQKKYVGSSIDVPRRWRQHKEASINEKDHHYNYPLMKAFREFGIDNFKFEIVDTLSNYKEMIQVEHDWIIKENCMYPHGYNQTTKTDTPMLDPDIAKKMSDTKREKYGKQVCEIDENNNILRIWNSLAEAGEETGLDRYKISSVCNGTRITTGNRKFRFLNEEGIILEPQKKTNQIQNHRIIGTSKRVAKMNENNEILEIYDSISLAAEANHCDASAISKVCNGKRNKCGGFKWKYQIN